MNRGATPHEMARLSAVLGSRIVLAERARWGYRNETFLVTTEDGGRLAVQFIAEPVLAPTRARVVGELAARLASQAIRTPVFVGGDPRANPPFILTTVVEGRSGAELLGEGVDAIALGTEMGRLIRYVQAVPVDGLRLPSTWSDPRRLAVLAERWLDQIRDRVALEERGPAAVAELEHLIDRIVPSLGGRRRVLAHGDWAPVNVVVRGRVIVAVVDWEFACLADPLLDIGWWGWVVWHHHPDVWPAAWSAFLETAGVDLDAPTVERLRILVALRLLQASVDRDRGKVDSGSPASEASGDVRRWLRRLVDLLDSSD